MDCCLALASSASWPPTSPTRGSWRGSAAPLLLRGTRAAASASVVLALATAFGWGGLAGLVIPLFVFISATGFIVANSITGALAGFPAQAGAVSALIGAIQYGSGMLGSALVGALADGTPRSMGIVIAFDVLGSLLCTRLLFPVRPVLQPWALKQCVKRQPAAEYCSSQKDANPDDTTHTIRDNADAAFAANLRGDPARIAPAFC